MKKYVLAFVLWMGWVGLAQAHGDISSLPDSAQIMQYKLLLYMSPDDPVPRNDLAMALFRTDQLEDAEKELRYILERDPLNFDALDGLGIVLNKAGRYQEALEYLKKALSINEKDVMVHVHLSVVYERLGLPEEAGNALKEARSLTSDPAELESIEKELKLIVGR